MTLPFGPPLLAIFVSIVLVVTLRSATNFATHKILGKLTGVGFLIALVLAVFGITSAVDFDSSIFEYSLMNRLGSAVFLTFLLLAHVTVTLTEIKADFDFYVSELIAGFLGLTLLQSDSLFMYPVVFCLLVVLVSSIPTNFNQNVGRQSLKRGIVYGLTFLLMFVGLISTLNLNIGSIYISDVLPAQDPELKWVRHTFFGVGIFSFVTLFFLPPFSFFDREYEKANSWAAFMFFRLMAPLLGSLLLVKWSFAGTYFLTDTDRTQSLFLIQGLFTNALFWVFAWVLLVCLITKKLRTLVTGLLSVPLILGVLAMLQGEIESITWGALSFLTYVFAAVFLSLLFQHSRVPLSSAVSQVRSWALAFFSERYILLTVLVLLLPIGNQVYFAVLKKVTLPWHSEGVESPLFVVLILMASAFSLVLVKNAPHLFQKDSTDDGQKGSVTLRLWNYILLIPLIILGIHPLPLYKYLKYILSSQF